MGWDADTCAAAAENGHLKLLAWARANGAAWDHETFTCAAFGGDMAVLEWLLAQGCEWTARTCAAAVESKNGAAAQLRVLKFLRANGCSWDKDTCTIAAGRGELEVLRYAFDTGCTTQRNTTRTHSAALPGL